MSVMSVMSHAPQIIQSVMSHGLQCLHLLLASRMPRGFLFGEGIAGSWAKFEGIVRSEEQAWKAAVDGGDDDEDNDFVGFKRKAFGGSFTGARGASDGKLDVGRRSVGHDNDPRQRPDKASAEL